jgi:hypothetical protein
MRKGQSFLQMLLGKPHVYMQTEVKLEPYLTLYPKINSKWMKHLNLRAKPMKLLEENIHNKKTSLY